jgi:uncharacterized protein (TIGR03435 family)
MLKRLSISLAIGVVAALPLRAQNPPASSEPQRVERPASSEPQRVERFEVATIKPTPPDFRGRFTRMQGAHQFEARGYTLKFMVASSYGVPLSSTSGGPPWIDSERYDITAATPGDGPPTTGQQMEMLRNLLTDRFTLTLHRESRELSAYELVVARGGVRLKGSTAPPKDAPVLVNRIFPGHVHLPGRNVPIAELASVLQRSVLDRYVLNRTGLTGRYDFDLEWTPDDTQFNGQLPPPVAEDPPKPDLFAAVQDQLGLRLVATKAAVDTIVIDGAERP